MGEHINQHGEIEGYRSKIEQAVDKHLSSLGLDINFPSGFLGKLTFRELARFLSLNFNQKGKLIEEGLNVPGYETRIAQALGINRSEAAAIKNLDGSGKNPIRTQPVSFDNFLEIEEEKSALQEEYHDFIKRLQLKLSSRKRPMK
jgi:hypothetical protein